MKTTKREGVTFAEPVRDAEDKVKALEAVSQKILDWQAVKKLESKAEYEGCLAVLCELKEQINIGERERHLIVDPLNGVVKHVNQKFKKYIGPREELEEHLKFLAKTYLAEQRAILAKEAEKEAKKADRAGAHQLAEDIRERAMTAVPTVTPGITYREHWTFRVTDETKVPREYMVVDESKLRKLAGPDAPKIPGVEFIRDTVVAVSA